MGLKNNDKQIFVKSILEVIKSKKQEGLLPEVSDALKNISDREKTEKKAIIWSVVSLNSSQLSRIKKVIINATGVDCEIENRTDASLLGGFRVTLGDWILDASLKSDLSNIQKTLN